jgi:hypothetical protein
VLVVGDLIVTLRGGDDLAGEGGAEPVAADGRATVLTAGLRGGVHEQTDGPGPGTPRPPAGAQATTGTDPRQEDAV